MTAKGGSGAPRLRTLLLAGCVVPALFAIAPGAHAACTPAAANNVTAICSGATNNQGGGAPGTSASTNGYGIGNETGVTVNVAAGSGNTVTGTSIGITFGDGAVNNGSGASISSGIYAQIGAVTINNSGTVTGGITATTNATVVNNASGIITDPGYAIYAIGNVDVTNSGTIGGGSQAVFADGSGTVTNSVGGNINASDYAVYLYGGGSSVFNAGSITASSNGGAAIEFSNPGNTVTLAPGSTITGNVYATGSDTFQLGGSGAATFDVSQIGPAAQYYGFGTFNKIDGSTWTLTGTPSQNTSWAINGGTLSVSSNANLGNANEALSFNGGILQVTGTTFTSTPRPITWGSAGGGFDIADAANTFTLAQTLTGSGPLSKLGAGTLTLMGANTYTGTTSVSAGTLRGGAANTFSAASATTVTGGGTLDLGGFAQAINNVSLAGGTLRNGALTGAVTSIGGAINALGGAATLTTAGGITTATGVNTYTGATNVNGGTLSVIGSITASNITVNTGGTLAGTGKTGDPAILAGGTLAPGSAMNPTGTLTIVGPLTFAAGSTYQVNVTPTANSRTNVTGTTTIGGGTVNVLAGSGTYAPGTRYTLLTAAGGVTGQFTSLQTTTNLAFLTPSLSYDANDIYLNLKQASTPAGTPVTFASVAATANQRSTANGVQSLPTNNPLYTAVLNQTVTGARQAFDALSGEVHSSEVTSQFETAFQVQTAILDRLRGFTPSAGFGVAGAEVPAAFAADLPGGRKPEVAAVPFTVLDPRVFALWGQGFGSFGSTRTNGNAGTLTRDTGGFVIGADATLDGTWRFGLAGGFTDTNIDVRARNSRGEVTSGFGAIYGGASFGAVQVRLGGAFAGNSTDTTRNVAFPGFSNSLSAKFGGTTFQGFGEIGYRVPVGAAATLEPFVGGAGIRISRDTFTETGGVGALTVFGRDYDTQTFTAGIKGEMALAAGSPFSLKGLVGYRHAFGDVSPVSLLAFAAGGSQFSTSGVPIDRDAVIAEAGVDWRVTSEVTLGLSYAGQAGSRANDNGVKGSVVYKF